MRIQSGTRLLTALVALSGPLACTELITGNDDSSRRVAERPFSLTVPRMGRGTLIIEGVTGSIEIVGSGATDEITVTGTRRTKAHTTSEAREALARLEVQVVETTRAITLRTVQPSNAGDVAYEVDYRVSVPSDLELDLELVTGAVVVRSTRGDIDVRNVTGSVALLDTEGAATVRLVTGTIHASLTVPPQRVTELSLTTGTMTVSIPSTTSARLTASVVTGTLSVTGLRIADEDPRANVVDGTLGTGLATLRLAAVTGTVVVTGR